MPDRVFLTKDDTLAFAPHAKLRFNAPRQQWVVLAPERLLEPDATAVRILRALDGKASVEAIVTQLSEAFDAPRERIREDVLAMLQDLFDKGFIEKQGNTHERDHEPSDA